MFCGHRDITMSKTNTLLWNFLKLIAGVKFISAICDLVLFFSMLAGRFKATSASWRFLHEQPALWTGIKLALFAALWIAVYHSANAAIRATSSKAERIS